jgi:hypothetical protein
MRYFVLLFALCVAIWSGWMVTHAFAEASRELNCRMDIANSSGADIRSCDDNRGNAGN